MDRGILMHPDAAAIQGDTGFAPFCAQLGVPVQTVHRVNDPSFIFRLASDGAIFGGINMRGLQKYGQGFIDNMAESGIAWLNFHPAKVPDYRGIMPVFRSMAAGDAENGLTVHTVDADYDTGPVHCTGDAQHPSRLLGV